MMLKDENILTESEEEFMKAIRNLFHFLTVARPIFEL